MICVCVCVSFATEYMADAKRKRAAGVEPEKGDYVRLSPSVEDFMGGKRYCKESELTRFAGCWRTSDRKGGSASAYSLFV